METSALMTIWHHFYTRRRLSNHDRRQYEDAIGLRLSCLRSTELQMGITRDHLYLRHADMRRVCRLADGSLFQCRVSSEVSLSHICACLGVAQETGTVLGYLAQFLNLAAFYFDAPLLHTLGLQGSTSSLWVPRSFWDPHAPTESAIHHLHIRSAASAATAAP